MSCGGIPRYYYLFCLTSEYSNDSVTVLFLSDNEYADMTEWILDLNENVFHTDTYVPNSISYCSKPFDTMLEARKYYNEHKNDILWITERMDLNLEEEN